MKLLTGLSWPVVTASGLRRGGWLLLMLLMLTGCSTTTFFYNRLHIFIPWMIDDYVNLNGEQDDQLEALLVDYLQTHRRDYLPRYIDFLDQTLASLDQPLTLQKVEDLYAVAAVEVRQLEQDSLDWLLAIGESLSEEQMQEFIEAMEEQQEEYAEEYLSRDQQAFEEQVYERLEDSLGDFLGRLQPEQRQLLREAAQQARRTDTVWLEQRAQRLAELKPLLQRPPGWQQQIRAMVARQYEPSAQENKKDSAQEIKVDSAQGNTENQPLLDVYDYNLKVFLQAVVDVVNSRSPRQDRRLRGKLEDLREDFQRLIEQGEARAP